ncbi:MAG: hypothetical protein EXQ59_03945 [Acidobacteria bacterium]|nr:hypothetical protein [Acidobacteriota bacterium]
MRMTILAAATSVLLASRPASAQLDAAKDGPIVYGHHHLNVTSVEVHKKFGIETQGGAAAALGTSTVAPTSN